ncbi:hypothetical protein E3Q11_02756 [Wallemia mellicola]|nr:hypothetical protein E3Q11_02756 [Wallemia mellicola]
MSLFGNTTSGGSGFNFGATAQPQQQQASGGFGFGGGSNTQASNTAAKPSLFGGAAAPTATQQPATTGFGGFGQQTQQPQQNQQQTQPQTGLFGSQQQSSTTGGTFGGFGQQQQQQQQPQPQQTNPLGASTNTPFGASTGFGTTSTLNQNTQNAQNTSQTAKLTRTTKFNDLPDAHRKIIEDIDAHIQGRSHIALALKAEPLGKDVDRSSVLLDQVSNDLMSLQGTLASTAASLDSLKNDTEQDTVRALTMTRIIDGYRRPQESGAWLKTYRDFPHEFFAQTAVDLKDRANKYTGTLEQIEKHLSYLLTANAAGHTPQSIAQILQTQHATFMSLASNVAELAAATTNLKDGYRDIWRSKTKSYADPFALSNVESNM